MARTRLTVFALACIALLVSAMGQQQQQQQPGAASGQVAQPSSSAGGANNQASSSDMQAVQPDQGVLNFAAQQVRAGA